MGRPGAVVKLFPLRLPAGWEPLAPVAGAPAAVRPNGDGERPAGVVTVTQTPPIATPEDILGQLRAAQPGLLVLDRGGACCRGGLPAHRLLTTHVQGGRSITTELWLVPGEPAAVLCAAVDTARYAGAASRRPARAAELPAVSAAPGTLAVDVDVLVGPRAGTGCCLIHGDLAVVDLPGLPVPRAIPTSVLPEWLAGLVGLGPRPAVSAPGLLIAPTTLLDTVLELAAPDHAAVAAAIAPSKVSGAWLALLAGIAASLATRWRVAVGPLNADPVESLEVLDCVGTGLWAVQPCPAEVAAEELGTAEAISLTPTTPTAVWAWLSRLAAPAVQEGPWVDGVPDPPR
jgi:hypothetical protein